MCVNIDTRKWTGALVGVVVLRVGMGRGTRGMGRLLIEREGGVVHFERKSQFARLIRDYLVVY